MSTRKLVKFTFNGKSDVYDWTNNQERVTGSYPDILEVDQKEGTLFTPSEISREYEFEMNPSGRDFYKMEVAYPHEQLRVNKIIDLVSPVAKGSRALVFASVNVGKTTLIKMMASSVAVNHPSVKQYALLIDERPEEVSDFRKNFKGMTIASTFDEEDEDHVLKAEMALEVLKREVEMEEDVVLYIDSATRLARSYSNLASSSEKILSGGITGSSLKKIKKILGAARCFEGCKGSLTIICTVLEGTDSKADDAVKTELYGSSNCIIQLDSRLSKLGYFPAINILESSTRNDEVIRPQNKLVERIKELESSPIEAYKALIERI